MKISELWLREWVNTTLNSEELAHLLTMSGLEIDSITPVSAGFSGVVVGKIIHIAPHPQADKLTLCTVDIGSETLHIVCGAKNVGVGLKVACATIGAKLPGDIVIKSSVLRGEPSDGMLCSATELGLESNATSGIMELYQEAVIGMDLYAYFQLNDRVFDINITPNRADCLSIMGIAREVAALTHTQINKSLANISVPEMLHNSKPKIKIATPNACPQYCARIIRNMNVAVDLPVFISERLQRAGIRSVHPVVDILNYVMLELGQPMHAFDLKKFTGNVNVRFGYAHEVLKLLNNTVVNLNTEVLVIADAEKSLAIAGVMGSYESAVSEQTTDIFLESAFFDPEIISYSTRLYALHTDAAQRFERGVDPALQLIALEYATQLLLTYTGGVVSSIECCQVPDLLPQVISIAFDPNMVQHLTGVDIDIATILDILRDLKMEVVVNADLWMVSPPSYRFDIKIAVDLVEEVLRVYGYDKLQFIDVATKIKCGTIDSLIVINKKLTDFFIARGYYETITYGFVDPQLQSCLYPNITAMEIVNPISPELSTMRLSLWPGLLASMLYNYNRQQNMIKIFECSKIFKVHAGIVTEQECFSGLLYGDIGLLNWSESKREFDFYDMKGDLQALFEYLHLSTVKFIATEHTALHPGKAAKILCNGREIGFCGVLNPRFMAALEITFDVFLFELSVDCLLDQNIKQYHTISKFPLIRRDLSVLMNVSLPATTVTTAIEQLLKKIDIDGCVRSLDIIDLYNGDNIPVNKKSLTISLSLQNTTRTLRDDEINLMIGNIISYLNEKFSITLR